MSKLQIRVGDIYHLKNLNKIRLVTKVHNNKVYYRAYSYDAVRNCFEYQYENDLPIDDFLYLFKEYKVPRLRAEILKSQLGG